MQRTTSIRIGTRQSKLALAQAEIVRQKLLATFPELAVTLVPTVTSGDRNTDKSLADIGGKGLFTKELEESLLGGQLDMAVHSLKDMETHLRPGLIIAGVLEREDPRDVLVSAGRKTLVQLAPGTVVGTSSIRRTAQLRALRRDFDIVPFRGNVTTRIDKLRLGVVGATLLAFAGLKRLGMEKEVTEILDTEHFLPAAGQGTIALECREDNSAMREMLTHIHHAESMSASLAERGLLAGLDGSCRTPIGAYARFEAGKLRLDAMIAKVDGSFSIATQRLGEAADAARLGEDAAKELLARGGRDCLA